MVDTFEKIAGCVGAGFIILIIFFLVASTNRMIDLNQQCLADGHKEYECYAMLHGGRGK